MKPVWERNQIEKESLVKQWWWLFDGVTVENPSDWRTVFIRWFIYAASFVKWIYIAWSHSRYGTWRYLWTPLTPVSLFSQLLEGESFPLDLVWYMVIMGLSYTGLMISAIVTRSMQKKNTERPLFWRWLFWFSWTTFVLTGIYTLPRTVPLFPNFNPFG
jgi:hypothetical protein